MYVSLVAFTNVRVSRYLDVVVVAPLHAMILRKKGVSRAVINIAFTAETLLRWHFLPPPPRELETDYFAQLVVRLPTHLMTEAAARCNKRLIDIY